MAAVTLASVSKRFGPSTAALDDVDLEVRDGELLVLLGPSGCGKTTALRIIAGLEQPDAGTVSIGDRCVDDTSPEDRDVAMVFQSYALFPHMSVRRNITFSLRHGGLSRREREREAERVAAQLGLTDVLGRKPRELSGGQQQRVALARAIVRRPQVFLMDEPLSNLDAQLRTRTRAELVELHRQIGTTIVYVTHDQVEALTMADRVAVLGGGRVHQVGTPREVYDRPANTFVAGFLGSPPMNLWSVHVDGGRALIGDVVVDASPPSAGDARDLVLGTRPESLRAGCADETGIVGEIGWVEDLGHELVLGGTLEAGPDFAMRWVEGGEAPHVGSRVGLRPDLAAAHWFDAATGERVA